MKMIDEEGKVGILYSPGWGAGWSTWGAPDEAISDYKLVKMVVDRNSNTSGEEFDSRTMEINKYVEEKWGEEVYVGGTEDLTVSWVPEGTKYRIDEHDGSEYLLTEEDLYLEA